MAFPKQCPQEVLPKSEKSLEELKALGNNSLVSILGLASWLNYLRDFTFWFDSLQQIWVFMNFFDHLLNLCELLHLTH